MLGKLLKYELKAMGRVLLPLYVVMIAACGLFALNIKLSEHSTLAAIFDRFIILTGTLMGLAIVAVTAVMVILIVQRFYKNLLGTEGYLMFTLPATTLDHILSKVISAFVWVVFGVLAGIGAGVVMISIFGDFQEFLREMIEAMGMIFDNSRLQQQLVMVVILLILGVTESLVKVYAAIAVGHQMGNHRLFFSVVAYLIFGVIELGLVRLPFVTAFMNSDLLTTQALGQFPRVVVIALIGTLVYGTLAWLLLDRRLNLE